MKADIPTRKDMPAEQTKNIHSNFSRSLLDIGPGLFSQADLQKVRVRNNTYRP